MTNEQIKKYEYGQKTKDGLLIKRTYCSNFGKFIIIVDNVNYFTIMYDYNPNNGEGLVLHDNIHKDFVICFDSVISAVDYLKEKVFPYDSVELSGIKN